MKTEHQPTTEFDIKPLGTMDYGTEGSDINFEANKGTEAQQAHTEAFIESGEGLVAVTEKDDGCIDGRPTLWALVKKGAAFVQEKIDALTKQRAKVAGGGYMTSLAMRLGIMGDHEANAEEELAKLGRDFAEKGVCCGAHTADHHSPGGTGCGANDKFREILTNAHVFRGEYDVETGEGSGIAATVATLLEKAGVEFDANIYNEVVDSWQDVAGNDKFFEGSTGESRLEVVKATQEAAATEEETPATTRELTGAHKEAYIIVNYVEGKTFSQAALYDSLIKEFGADDAENLPQAFVVDAWRIVQLAQAAAGDADVLRAIYAGVAYQVATAATLTDGSMRLYSVTK